MSDDPRDRRSHPRLEGEFQVDLLNMGDDPTIPSSEAVVPGVALDISRKGMRLKADYNVGVGTLLSAITYYRKHESICLCEVVWKREVENKKVYGLFIKEWSKMDPILEKKLAAMERAEQKEKDLPNSSAPTAHAVVTA
jgi:hypothetical protein